MRLTAQGRTLPELFENASGQFLSSLVDPNEVGETLREKLVVEAEDLSSLLCEWITALANLAQLQKILFRKTRIEKIETSTGKPYTVRAEILGELLDPLRHAFKEPLVGLRCSQSQVAQEKTGYKADFQVGR